jgi:hypothetical protein
MDADLDIHLSNLIPYTFQRSAGANHLIPAGLTNSGPGPATGQCLLPLPSEQKSHRQGRHLPDLQ